MSRARTRSLWLAASALAAACSSPASTQSATTVPIGSGAPPTATTPAVTTQPPATTPATSPGTTTTPTVPAPTTAVPVDPTVLIPVAIGNKPFPADADELAAEHHGYTGDPNATLQAWLITPMAVPSGPDVRLLGFERSVGITSTTAVFLTGAIEPEAALAAIRTSLAPDTTYTVTPSTRHEGTVTIHGFDAQPNTVRNEPPGWMVEASVVDQLGIVRIKRNDYGFDKVVPAFSDLPTPLQSAVLNQDAIAVSVGGALASIAYEYGTNSLGDEPEHRTRLGYDIAHDFPTATADLKARLTVGWNVNEQVDSVFFTSTTTSEIWTLDNVGGATHLTYDTGS